MQIITIENTIEKFVKNLEYIPGAKEDQISDAEKALKLELPDQYKSFILHRNGVEGLLQNFLYFIMASRRLKAV